MASDVPQIGFLTHKVANENEGYFALVAEPQKSPKTSEIRSKEIVFRARYLWVHAGSTHRNREEGDEKSYFQLEPGAIVSMSIISIPRFSHSFPSRKSLTNKLRGKVSNMWIISRRVAEL